MSSTTLLATDQQHSVLKTLKANQLPQTIPYSPYGHRPAASGLLSLLGFNGELADRRTGHYLLGNGYRAFNPMLMRFNSPDSLSPFEEGGLNPFAYCVGDPINLKDPTGQSHLLKFQQSVRRVITHHHMIKVQRNIDALETKKTLKNYTQLLAETKKAHETRVPELRALARDVLLDNRALFKNAPPNLLKNIKETSIGTKRDIKTLESRAIRDHRGRLTDIQPGFIRLRFDDRIYSGTENLRELAESFESKIKKIRGLGPRLF